MADPRHSTAWCRSGTLTPLCSLLLCGQKDGWGGGGIDQEGNKVLEKEEICCESEEWAQVWVSGPWLVRLVKTMVCGLRRWVKCWCFQGKGMRGEMVYAGDEAELSLGAGGGADPWQGDVGGCRRINLGWTSPTLGNRHCRTLPILQLNVQGDTSVPVSLPPLRAVPSSLGSPGDGGHPFLSLPAGPPPWPTQTCVCSDPAVLPCLWSVPLSHLQGRASCAWGMSSTPW